MSALICYGFLAYLLIPKMPSRFWKWVVGHRGPVDRAF